MTDLTDGASICHTRLPPPRCDLQIVSSGTAVAIILKQLRIAKCSNWEELARMLEML